MLGYIETERDVSILRRGYSCVNRKVLDAPTQATVARGLFTIQFQDRLKCQASNGESNGWPIWSVRDKSRNTTNDGGSISACRLMAWHLVWDQEQCQFDSDHADQFKMRSPMTSDEKREFDYRVTERLGIMAEDREPTPEQIAIATTEAEAWLRESRWELI